MPAYYLLHSALYPYTMHGMRAPLYIQKGSRSSNPTYDCSAYKEQHLSCFGIIINTDQDVSLQAFPSKACYLAVQRHIKASSTKTPYRCMVKTYDWTKHSPHSCEVKLVTILCIDTDGITYSSMSTATNTLTAS